MPLKLTDYSIINLTIMRVGELLFLSHKNCNFCGEYYSMSLNKSLCYELVGKMYKLHCYNSIGTCLDCIHILGKLLISSNNAIVNYCPSCHLIDLSSI